MTDNLVRLEDYAPVSYTISQADLVFKLNPSATQVEARLQLQQQGSSTSAELHGVGLKLHYIAINGHELSAQDYTYDGETLRLTNLPAECELHTIVEIDPAANTALEGLYMSNGMFCTQCEAEGFRRITFFHDRPDVLCRYTVTLWGEKATYPLLLANGNLVETGEHGDQHWAKWEDPFPKPSYLFAVVAGDLACLRSSYTTLEGREVTLEIFAEEKDLPKLEHAMDSLKAAMAWDEKVYGLSYDLDLYMVVAVSHFNLGAMENKGLNIFNTACVLAHPDTTTDVGFQRVEAVVGHEYFHNWSGNRITLRDWFQLCLKEGLTVFREQRFCEDSNDAGVKRVEDVKLLKAHQFPEDQGPLAHPVRPSSYQDIDNFYTATTYEKGAELVRMQWELLGENTFLQGADVYFKRFDGKAATVEDFQACMEEVSGRSLQQFQRWYTQAGTPQVTISEDFSNGVYTLTAKQYTPPTADQAHKEPFVIPLRMALLDNDGNAIALDDNGSTEIVWEINQQEESRSWSLAEAPTPSLLRRFSAPIDLHFSYSVEQLLHLVEHDTDGYVRWQAMQTLYHQAMDNDELQADIAQLGQQLLLNAKGDEAMTALLLQLPTLPELALPRAEADYAYLQERRLQLASRLGRALASQWQQCLLSRQTAYSVDPISIGKRHLQRVALFYLAASDSHAVDLLLTELYQHADNMTERADALRLACHFATPSAPELLTQAYDAALADDLVMDQWFAVQATKPHVDTVEQVARLLEHEQFDWKSPNRVRSVLGQWLQHNPLAFHRADGAGYELFRTSIITFDEINPQMAARLLSAVMSWRKLPAQQQALMEKQLLALQAANLSKQCNEVLEQLLQSKN